MSSKKKAEADLPGDLYVQQRTQERVREQATEVRNLIKQSMELEKLSKQLEETGYAEWVESGSKKRFYEIVEILSAGTDTARQYWEERNSSGRRFHSITASHAVKVKRSPISDDFEP